MSDVQETSAITIEERAKTVSDVLGVPSVEIRPAGSGGNSRTYRVEAGETRLLAKWYDDHGRGRTKRQQAEWSFLKFAESRALQNVPRAVARSSSGGVTVMTWLEGRPLDGAPQKEQVAVAAQFVSDINDAGVEGADVLPSAAEGGFSFAHHSEILASRTQRLRRLHDDGILPERAAVVVNEIDECHQIWRNCVAGADARLITNLPQSERRISPSDFGFHNVLVDRDGGLLFHDFEYAGWDDPAKLVCDFFWQPAVPVDQEHRNMFMMKVLGGSSMTAAHRERIGLLDPLFGLRWCCIFLNAFFPDWIRSRGLASRGGNISAIQLERLARAQLYLDEIKLRLASFPR